MSTELRLASWPAAVQTSTRLRSISMIRPVRKGWPQAGQRKWTGKSLVLTAVVATHVLVFAVLLAQSTVAPLPPEEPAVPMMVSLVSEPAPEPEIVPLLPEPPKPEPVVEKVVPKPKPKPEPVVKPEPKLEPLPEPLPIPQPVVQQAPSMPVEPPPPKPAAPVAAPPAPVQPAKVEPLPEPEPEPVIEPPRFGAAYLHNPSPRYPTLSRRMGEEGRVLLRVLVAKNGSAETVQIETGSGSRRLDQAALEAVKEWTFVPAKRNNQPISAYVLVPIKFSLQDS